LHILDAIERIRHIQERGDLTQDQALYDAALRNLQTLSEATQQLPDTVATVVDRYLEPWRRLLAPCCGNFESIWVPGEGQRKSNVQ